MRLKIHPAARIELREAVLYYRDIEWELAVAFNNETRKAIEWAVENPRLLRKRGPRFKRLNLKQFPYYLAYMPLGEQIVLLAIAHSSRDPDYWKNRLPDRP